MNLVLLAALSVLVGVIAGFGAVVFRGMIAAFHNILFLGYFQFDWGLFEYNANVHTAASPWGAAIILVPILGALGVTFLVQTFAPEAKGHGVPEVVDSIYYNNGIIRPIVVVIKSLASALSIGSGGSVGREGPIIQIGAAFGSTLGQILRMSYSDRVILIGAGAGGGIAATFNTPAGGVLFAIELMLVVVVARSLMSVVLATCVATWIGRMYLGDVPSFNIPPLAKMSDHLAMPENYVAVVLLGLAMGLVATVMVRAIYKFEDLFDAMPGNPYTRHMSGMAIVGVMIWLMIHFKGHYYIQGVGYATIEDVLREETLAQMSLGFLLLLAVAKLLATSLTLGSGASGGVFSPGLFLGATTGAAFGIVAHDIFPDLELPVSTFAVAGMAAMIGGTTGAVMTGVVMLSEMTRDYNAILPILVTTAIANAVRRKLCPPTIYTLKLLRRGHLVPEGLQAVKPQAPEAVSK